jgi:hypothetical protein
VYSEIHQKLKIEQMQSTSTNVYQTALCTDENQRSHSKFGKFRRKSRSPFHLLILELLNGCLIMWSLLFGGCTSIHKFDRASGDLDTALV